MKLILTTPIYPPDIGGPATYSYEIIKRLTARKHEIKTVTTSDIATPQTNVFVIRHDVKVKLIGFFLQEMVLIRRLLKVSKDADIIYTLNPTFLGLTSLLVGKISRKPVILRFSGDIAWEQSFGKSLTSYKLEDYLAKLSTEPLWGGRKNTFYIQKLVFHSVNKIIVPSAYLKNILINYYHVNVKKVTVIYNSIDVLPDQVKENYDIKGPTIIYAGRLIKHKNIDKIIYAVKELSVTYPEIKLIVAGDGPERNNLICLSEMLGIRHNVNFLGTVDRKGLWKLFVSSDLFVLFSIYEALPNVVIEAMASGIPVILSDIEGVREIVDHEESGLLVPEGDEKALSEAMRRLIIDSGKRAWMARNASDRVRQRFNWEENIKILERELVFEK